MTGKGCGKHGHRKHTPIVSKAQRGQIGADYQRVKEGKAPRATEGMTQAERKSHLEESKGKHLPRRAHHKR